MFLERMLLIIGENFFYRSKFGKYMNNFVNRRDKKLKFIKYAYY